MFSAFRNATLAALGAALVLISPAQATWLVDYTVDFPAGNVHLQFDTPTLLSTDTTSTFTLNPQGASAFEYALAGSGQACIFASHLPAEFAPCDAIAVPSFGGGQAALTSTANPNVFTDSFGGTLTFTNLAAAVPEPASLALFGIGLAGLGMALRTRRA